jgi:hypothetical protein
MRNLPTLVPMNSPNHDVRNSRTHQARNRVAVLAAIAGVALLAAGCGSGGLTVSASAGGSGTPSYAGGAGSSAANPSSSPSGDQGFVNPAEEQVGAGNRSGVTGGALFGGNGQLAQVDAKLDRKLAIVREYYHIGEKFPTPINRELMQSGSTLLVSLDTQPGSGPSYASIAAGNEDASISAFLEAMNQDAVTYHLGAIYICFEHEADNPIHMKLGSPAEFVRAWDHVHQLAASAHLDWNQGGRLHWVLILEHTAYFRDLPQFLVNGGGGANAYWPGTNEVDIVGADGYNHIGCKQKGRSGSGGVTSGSPSLTPEAIFDPVVSFAHSHGGLPVFIAEWGSQAFNGSGNLSSEQPAFIAQMRAYVSANHEIAGAMYWDSRSPENPGCSSIINNQPASVSALAAMGHSVGLQGRIVDPS